MAIDYEEKVIKDSSGFVLLADQVPGIVQEIRYYSTYNFVGDRIDGYEEPCALLTKEAARALKAVSNEVNVQGYRLKIFDAYRPVAAVKHFVLWGIEDLDLRMKPYFYPELEKQELFSRGYIASQSSHSRGSTVDLTLLDMQTGKEVDMGSPFDLFSEVSHPDYRGITEEQYANRMLLQKVMMRNGFLPIDCEWWHFTLRDEPYPDIYFDFPVTRLK
ncbi:MAG: M15 family metallopeptidase [Eubacterium sp.]|nr:M15 family metallopeptidase [Eubacterium sp.]